MKPFVVSDTQTIINFTMGQPTEERPYNAAYGILTLNGRTVQASQFLVPITLLDQRGLQQHVAVNPGTLGIAKASYGDFP